MKDLNFATPKKNVPTDIKAFQIKLASPETIQSWSSGEVTKPETINYRSLKPEKDGLFCERIFGPSKNWECNCGKYKGIRYRGVVCDRCGVEITISKVRRERLGHIKLAVPVSHIWFFKSLPSRIGYLLDISPRNLERILYYESYVVIDPGDTELKKGDLISEEEYSTLLSEGGQLEAKMGAGAIRHLLALIDIEELSAGLRAQIKLESSAQRKKEKLKRLRVVEAFRQSGNRPEWMILEVIPVIPPDLRPLVPLEGGRFAISDLNDLYRRVINRNNRLKKLIEIKAPEVILRNEKRMLQEAVDDLFDNGRRSRAIRGEGNRPLKSLSDLLKGKQGRFRQNLLGKRVDYSGRSVIVIGPELKLSQCGLPKSMALELFKPFIIKKLEDRGYVQTVKSAKRLVEREKPEVWDILEEIIQDHPVLLNRAPTLHRLGIQAFQPVLVEGKAIRIHPLVCQAFNADFDGDQMAVHVPLSFEAQIEARVLMLSSNNILSPANGLPLATPSQEIVLGIYYLTKERRGSSGDGMIFRDIGEVISAYQTDEVEIHARIKVRGLNRIKEPQLETPEMLADPDLWSDYTTVGRVVFNSLLPEETRFYDYSAKEMVEEVTKRKERFGGKLKAADSLTINSQAARTLHRSYFDKGGLVQMVAKAYRKLGVFKTAQMLDSIKDIGFTYATLGGITVSIDDMIIPREKAKLIAEAQKEVDFYTDKYMRKTITNTERYNRVIDVWTRTTNDMTDRMFAEMENDRDGFNPVFMMAESGARGSKDQIRQLAAMRGLMAKPQKKITGQIGEIIESPITSNLREGLTVLEYFISTHGARKGLADTALKTADAGYLTRRLVDVAQDVIITVEDCGTILGLSVGALKEGEDVIEPLRDRILGRVALEDLVDPISGEVLTGAGSEIDEAAAEMAEESGVEQVRIRSVLTCEAKRGVCAGCYGRNLATGNLVDIGEAVGVMAAQSIGEPGTQLTLRTFHIGGTAARIEAQSKVKAKTDGRVSFENLELIKRDGQAKITLSRHGSIRLIDDQDRVRASYHVPYGALVNVQDSDRVEVGDSIFEWDPYAEPILTEKSGTVHFMDIKDGVTLSEELDEITGLRQMVIVEHKQKVLNPRIRIVDSKGDALTTLQVPIGSHIMIQDGVKVKAGELLAKIPREISKTRDITGGLPRVAELFEARKPKEAAIITEIDGAVKFGGTTRGLQKIIVLAESGEEREYLIPHGKHLRVRQGDAVKAGDKLSEGPINPHDILKVKGADEVQEYLVNAIQEVYRLQGVKVNDKHIEIIVRQMLQKVNIGDPGDTNFLEGDQVDKVAFREENEKVIAIGGEPATSKPLLMGITKASLSTDSFLSAASFQETTRVLTEAAVQGKRDELRGLKENVIIGHIIPAGTGVPRFDRLKVIAEMDELGPLDDSDEEEPENIG